MDFARVDRGKYLCHSESQRQTTGSYIIYALPFPCRKRAGLFFVHFLYIIFLIFAKNVKD